MSFDLLRKTVGKRRQEIYHLLTVSAVLALGRLNKCRFRWHWEEGQDAGLMQHSSNQPQ